MDMLKSLSSALQLIGHFTHSQPTWGVRELAKESGVHPAIVHRVLATFAAEGFLVQNKLGRYALGLRWLELGEIVRQSLEPSQVVEPVLHSLALQSGETVFLSLLDGKEGICLDIAYSEQQLRFSIKEGQRFPLFAGSHGKAMLAHLPEGARKAVYDQAEKQGHAINRKTVEEHLAQIRETGWAYTHEESAPGSAGLAVPIWSRDHKEIAGSLAIAGPLQRLEEPKIPQLLEGLFAAQHSIERALVLLG
jgi:DNA-binding IclR family transcriptional regulator